MKNIILIAMGLFLIGCANLSVQTPSWSMRASSFCKDIQVPKVVVTNTETTNTIMVEGYKSVVNAVMLQNITDSVVSMIIKAGMNAVMK
jgi:hypothetical protein